MMWNSYNLREGQHRSICDMFVVWDFDYWYLKWIHQEKRKCLKLFSDTSKFEKLNEDPTLKRLASLQRFLRKLKHKNLFDENEYDKLYPSGSALARIYDTPKMHRFSSFPKFCPIVSFIGTFNYNLPDFLCDLLSPLVPNDYFSAKILFLLFLKLRMQIFPENLFSYHITSLLLIFHFKKPLI